MSEENINEGGQEEQSIEGSQEQAHWTSSFEPDLRDNPTLQKYTSQDAANRGHLEAVKAIGQDKMLKPKDADDTVAWGEMNKFLGVPDKGEGYNLESVEMPEGAGVFNKGQFQDILKEANTPQASANSLWKSYTDSMKGAVSHAQEQLTGKTNEMIAGLKSEWGEAYNTQIDRGQAVIDTLAGSEDTANFLTAQLQGDARGMKFLAEIGAKFSESSIGGFQEKSSFTLTPLQAKEELATIKANPDYRSDNDRVRKPMVERANELMRLANGVK